MRTTGSMVREKRKLDKNFTFKIFARKSKKNIEVINLSKDNNLTSAYQILQENLITIEVIN